MPVKCVKDTVVVLAHASLTIVVTAGPSAPVYVSGPTQKGTFTLDNT